MESPTGPIVNQDGTFGISIRKGLKQIEDWDHWIDGHFAHLKLMFQKYLGAMQTLPDEFITLDSKSQITSAPKEIYNKDFDWTITIPESFETVSPEEWQKMQNRGAEAIEKTFDEKVDNQAKRLDCRN